MPRAATLLGALGASAALGVRLPAAAEERGLRQLATPLTRAEAWWQRRHGARAARAGARARQWPESGSQAYGSDDGDFVYPPGLVFGNAATPTNPPSAPTTTEMGTPWDYSQVDPITGLPKTHPIKHPDWPGGIGGGADGVGAGGEPFDAAGAPLPGGGGVGGATGDVNQDVAGETNPFGLPPAMTTTDVGQGGHVFRDPLNDYVIDQPNYIEEYTWPEFYQEVMDETSGTAEPTVEPPPLPTPMATTSHPTRTTQSLAHLEPGHYDREAARVPAWLAQAASGASAADEGAEEAEARDSHGPAAMLQLAAEPRGGAAPPEAIDDPGRDWVDEMMRRLDPASS